MMVPDRIPQPCNNPVSILTQPKHRGRGLSRDPGPRARGGNSHVKPAPILGTRMFTIFSPKLCYSQQQSARSIVSFFNYPPDSSEESVPTDRALNPRRTGLFFSARSSCDVRRRVVDTNTSELVARRSVSYAPSDNSFLSGNKFVRTACPNSTRGVEEG